MIRTNLIANTKLYFILGILLIIVMISKPAQGAWKSGGPYGGYVNCLGMAKTNPDIMYAGTEAGVFKTINAGANWSKTAFPHIRVLDVQVAPDDSNTVFAGTEDGIFKSEDGGQSWSRIGLAGATINSIAIDSSNPNTVYLGAGIDPSSTGDILGLYKSIDGGETWSEKIGEELAVFSILMDTNDSSIIYAGVHDSDSSTNLRKSIDGGSNWTSSLIGNISTRATVAFAMTPSAYNPITIYAILKAGDVFKSTDRGENWVSTYTPFVSIAYPWALAIDPNDPDVVYAGTQYYQGCFYKSEDGGDTWSIKVNGLPPSVPASIVIDPRNSDVVAGIYEGGVYKSTDTAESWFSVNQRLNNTYIEDLTVDPTNSKTVLTAIQGKGYHLAKTFNGGYFWNYLLDLRTNLSAVSIAPNNPDIIFAGEGWHSGSFLYVYKSTDGGLTWTEIRLIYVVPPGSMTFGVSDIWVNPSESDMILVAVAGHETGVFRSINGGTSWSRTYQHWASTLAADPYDSSIVYLGTARNGYVFKSENGGITWEIISPGGDWVWEVRDLEIDRNSHLYAATDEGLFKWDNSNWSKMTGLPSDDITSLAIYYNTDTLTIYAGTGERGVFVSRDSGGTWLPFNERLETLSITKLSISKTGPIMLYAGTAYGGVWGRALTNAALPWIPLILFGDF